MSASVTPAMVTRVESGVVMEAPFPLVGDFTIAQSFPPTVAALMVEVPAGVTVEEEHLYANGTFTAATIVEPPSRISPEALASGFPPGDDDR